MPVLILAFATRTYFKTQFEAEVKEAAARTATVAQRLVEDYATLQRRGEAALATLDDPIMVLVRRAIDQDVNLFERSQLRATSARDLFASGLLPTRTPSDVYRHIVLDRMPTFVSEEAVISAASGDSRYLLAAAPVRAGEREGIVTVPDHAAPAGDRAADRRPGPPGAGGGRAVQPAGRRARLLDGGARRGSDQPADPRDPAHRARQSRRARRRGERPTSSAG